MKEIVDISTIVANPELPVSKEKILLRKEALLKHALINVSFYRNNIKASGAVSLSNFPVIDKNIIRDHINEFIAEGRASEKLHKVVTSGSTGTPFFVYQDAKKKLRNTADTIHFSKLAGFELGTQLFYLKIWNSVNRKGKLKSLIENIIPIDVTDLSDKSIQELVRQFTSDNRPKAFLGYASSLESICRYLENQEVGNVINNVTSIIAMSEAISGYAKKTLYRHFGVHPVSRYSNVENGIIAQQMPNGTDSFVINWASYFIEVLEMETDSHAEMGVAGRIVITDYFNYSMPIIRYDTGDIGILNWDEKKERQLLTKVEGRKMDLVFNTTGDLVSSFTITNNMWLYPEIKQYQFIQVSKNSYLFKLNLEGTFEREQFLISEFKKYFGSDAEISVEYVTEIPLLNSGKRKKVLNLMKKKNNV
jgi:phenylacetate-CoA ligase